MKSMIINNVEVLLLEGRIDQELLEELQETLENCLEKDSLNICIDMINVKFISSRVLGLLNKMRQDFKDQDGDIKLVIIDENLLKPFQITMLDTVFEIFENRRECISAFKTADFPQPIGPLKSIISSTGMPYSSWAKASLYS